MEGTWWACLLGLATLILATPAVTWTTSSRPPRLTRCVFLDRSNVTCHWEAAEPPARSYTLEVKKVTPLQLWISLRKNGSEVPGRSFSCTTSDSNCTIVTNLSSSFPFCVSITAHLDSGDVTSRRPCQSGILETMLPPVTLKSVTPHTGDATCLNVTWGLKKADFPLSNTEIIGERGKLKSQIEITAQGQSDVDVRNVTVRDYSFRFCRLKPDTSYAVRLRHRYDSPESPWSSWSLPSLGRTSERTPSAAPPFWSKVSPGDQDGWRRVTLLWKPLPHFQANGRILFFNVTCRGARQVKELDDCRDLRATDTSCSLRLPPGRCSCKLAASNSAGSSPEAQVWLRSASEKALPPLGGVAAIPLDDHRLDIRWTAPAGGPVSGFVAEWFAARDDGSAVAPLWEQLNASRTSLVITEGVQPMERYIVSVTALYGEGGAGPSKTVTIYTRQGVPSAGPAVSIERTSGNTVKLSWLTVPVEQRRGFIRNYTLLYSMDQRDAWRESLPANSRSYTLKNLMPGTYFICMQANTDAGGGANGSTINVHITEEDSFVLIYALLTLLLTSLLLMLTACVVVKKELSQRVPDPSNSSLAHWSSKGHPKGGMLPVLPVSAEINISALTLLGERRPLTFTWDEDLRTQSLDFLRSHTYYCYSQPPVSEDQDAKSPAPRARMTLNSCLFSVWPTEFCSRTLAGSPLQPLLAFNLQAPELQPHALCASDPVWPLGGVCALTRAAHGLGADEPSISARTSADGEPPESSWTFPASDSALFLPLEGLRSIVKLQNTVATSRSAELPPGPENLCSSSSSLAPSSALTPPELLMLPQPPSMFVDFSYCHL